MVRWGRRYAERQVYRRFHFLRIRRDVDAGLVVNRAPFPASHAHKTELDEEAKETSLHTLGGDVDSYRNHYNHVCLDRALKSRKKVGVTLGLAGPRR